MNNAEQIGSIQPSEGYAAIGAMGLVFEVPETWSHGDVQCGVPLSDTVYFGGGGRSCGIESTNPPYSSLQFGDDTNTGIPRKMLLEGVGIPGSEYVVTNPDFDGELWTFYVHERVEVSAVARFSSRDETDAKHAHESLRKIPDQMVAVPMVAGPAEEALKRLEAAGLSHRERYVAEESGFPKGYVRNIDPSAGSIVGRGETVTVSVTN